MRCGEQVQLLLVNGAAETCNTCHRLQAAHCTPNSTAAAAACCLQLAACHNKLRLHFLLLRTDNAQQNWTRPDARNAKRFIPFPPLSPASPATLLASAPLSLAPPTASQWPMKATSDPAETVVIAERRFGVVEPPRPPRDEVNTLASCLMLNGTKIFLIKHFLTLISANGGKTLRKLPLFCITLCYKVCKWEGTLTVLFLPYSW